METPQISAAVGVPCPGGGNAQDQNGAAGQTNGQGIQGMWFAATPGLTAAGGGAGSGSTPTSTPGYGY